MPSERELYRRARGHDSANRFLSSRGRIAGTGAIAAGAQLTRAIQDPFYGERSGKIRDPFGYDWLIGHTIEAVDPEEMQRRYTALLSGDPQKT